jgi:hypothetical protein
MFFILQIATRRAFCPILSTSWNFARFLSSASLHANAFFPTTKPLFFSEEEQGPAASERVRAVQRSSKSKSTDDYGFGLSSLPTKANCSRDPFLRQRPTAAATKALQSTIQCGSDLLLRQRPTTSATTDNLLECFFIQQLVFFPL